jgi:hypothetical protein
MGSTFILRLDGEGREISECLNERDEMDFVTEKKD